MSENRKARLITFKVADEMLVLDIMAVRQITPYTGSTVVPDAPGFIEGIIVLRNEVIPVIDLRSRLFPTLPPLERQPLVMITRTSAGIVGLKVDEVRRILTVEVDSILPPPPLVRGAHGDLFIGVIASGEEVLLLLDLDYLLTEHEQESIRAVRQELASAG